MSQEQYYSGLKEMSGMLKTMFRNQSVFVARSNKQTDLKANMLISLSFYLLVGIILIYLTFDTFIHFSPWILIIPCLLAFLCIIECIYIVAPNGRMLMKIIKELKSEYPEDKFHNMYNMAELNLADTELAADAMMDDHDLQLGNIIRSHYVSTKYISNKYGHLDKAYNYFLATLAVSFILFLVNVIASGGHFHEHNERTGYANFLFDDPSKTFVLDEKLEEISGLTYNISEKVLYAMNDEKGRIYKLDPETGKIISDYKFSGKGDYEGIELVDNEILVTNSSGDIFISNFEEHKAIIQHTPLSEINDVEGMGYDISTNQILLACKGMPWLPIEGDKAIYRYNQEFHRMDSTVFLDIKINDLVACVDSIYLDASMKSGLTRRLREFAPSAVAIDPSNLDIYVLTAHRSILAVYDKSKKIRDVIHLNEIIVPQPEGICFDHNNNLYISTEGHGGSAKLFMFERKEH